MSTEDPAKGAAGDAGGSEGVPDAAPSEVEALEDELEMLRRDNRGMLRDLQDVKAAERRAQTSLDKLQRMSKSQAAVLRAYAGQKLRDALQLVDDAIAVARPAGALQAGRGEDLLERRAVLSEYLKSGTFAADAPPPSDAAEVSALREENARLQRSLAAAERAEKAAALEERVEALEAERSALAAENDALKAAATEEKVQGLTAEVARLEGLLAAAEASSASSCEALRSELAAKARTHEKEKEEIMACMAQEVEAVEARAAGEREGLEARLSLATSKQAKSLRDARAVLSAALKQAEALRDLQREARLAAEALPGAADEAARRVAGALQTRERAAAELERRYRSEAAERRRLHNLVQELRGNIRVYCRVRPPSANELARGAEASQVCASFPREQCVRLVNERGKQKAWEFDKVFDFGARQEAVYAEVSGLVTSVLDGYKVCIFAYGQTGAGKTYTMNGPEGDRGVNTRALAELFAASAARGAEVRDEITVSVLEIYNETIRDLLAEDVGARKLEVRRGERGMHVPGLTSRRVERPDEVLELFARAEQNRSSAATHMNAQSSRSHLMLSVYVDSTNVLTGDRSYGKMHLVDLAGSERIHKSGATGKALREAQNINKSLSALGDVIMSRAQKNSHVPFRNSVLTHLLQDSLSADAKTLMIVCISPAIYNADESFSSLNFAARVKTVELGRAQRSVQRGDAAAAKRA